MKNKLSDANIVFLGSGFMASALIRGMVGHGLAAAEHIAVRGAAHPEKIDALRAAYGVRAASDADIAATDMVVLAFKPQNLADAAAQYAPLIAPGTLVLSILAGVPCATLERLFDGVHVVRAMPNLALSVGLAATGYCAGTDAQESDLCAVREIFDTLGVCAQVEESRMSDITALSGSGPAYFYLLTEAMIDTAVARGMDAVGARGLAVQTLIGAARLIADSGDAPADARAKITSKGGTTEAAVREMLAAGFTDAVARGMDACARRSDELGK